MKYRPVSTSTINHLIAASFAFVCLGLISLISGLLWTAHEHPTTAERVLLVNWILGPSLTAAGLTLAFAAFRQSLGRYRRSTGMDYRYLWALAFAWITVGTYMLLYALVPSLHSTFWP